MQFNNESIETRRRLDDLKDLKEGEIFVDENGKKYKVRKSILPQAAISGPHGEGDPDDRTLRRIEADVIIPNKMNKVIERVECHELYLGLVNCMRTEGDFKGIQNCKDALQIFNICKKAKFEDTNFRQLITNQYLEERSELRKTGKSPNLRRLEKFREWKKNQAANV